MIVDYKAAAGASNALVASTFSLLIPEIERSKAAQAQGYESAYASLWLPYDEQLLHDVKRLSQSIKKLQPTLLVVIGIGGSNLGTWAVQEALLGKLYNLDADPMKVLYADTVDSDYIWDIALRVEQELEQQGTVILNVVSKSGTTTETIANFEILLAILRTFLGDEYNRYVVATTDKNSALWDFAQNQGFACLSIPAKVGGRFSVFSAVGLFPLALLGIDIEQLHAGARAMFAECLQTSETKNYAALSAAWLYIHYQERKIIHDTFIFSSDLEGVGRWYRQLMGESIGKEYDREGNKASVGITPTVSMGSTDLHSVGQLYFGGPADKFTTFITVEKNKSVCVVPDQPAFNALVPHIQGKELSAIMNAIIHGTQQAYRDRKLPFTTITLAEKSAYELGQLLQFKMCEIIYLGFLLRVNPFDQPNVEEYKKITKKVLAHE